MKSYQQTLALLLLVGIGSAPFTACARDVQLRDRPGSSSTPSVSTTQTQQAQAAVNTESLSTEDRLRRLERLLESQGLVSLMVQQQEIQQELQRLRGEIEVQTHTVSELRNRQRELYVDIDRRLLALERHGGRAPAASAPAGAGGAANASATSSGAAASAAPAASTASVQGEQEAYQKAFDLLRALRYDLAIQSFRDFIRQFPNGRYAHIAQYWIGEANYAQRRFAEAIVDYQALLQNYSNSPKLAEAMLKIGYSQFELKQYDQARDSLERLIKAYPGTTEAGQAQNLLQKIRVNQSAAQ
ncbi:MAG: tol-pal system protein YbgF [Gammaproteobacteria bacterium]